MKLNILLHEIETTPKRIENFLSDSFNGEAKRG